jgi:hypothetical protein
VPESALQSSMLASNLLLVIVLVEGYPAMFFAFSVLVYHVGFFEDADQMFCMFFPNVFYGEIVHN